MPGKHQSCGEPPPISGRERPAAEIEVTLFRQILLVPFAIEAADGGGRSVAELRAAVARQLEGDPERRWVRVAEPLLHLPEDRVPDGVAPAERARRLAPAYEEFVYFEPFVQDFLFGTGSGGEPPLQLWQRRGREKLDITYDTAQRPADTNAEPTDESRIVTFRFSLDRCNLYLFSTGNAVLAIELGLEGRCRGTDVEPIVSLAETLSLLESVRRMFPPYFERSHDPEPQLQAIYYPRRAAFLDAAGGAEREQLTYEIDPVAIIAKVVGSGRDGALPKSVPLFEAWRHLVEPLTVKGYEEPNGGSTVAVLTQLGDDRAFVLAQVGVRDPHEISPGDWVRLCFLDTPGPGFPYAEGFLDSFAAQHCYDRFFSRTRHAWHTTRYLVCNYAMVVVGATPAIFEEAAGRSFFRQVLGRHIRRQYFGIVLIALLQKTALKTLSDRIAAIDAGDPEAVTAIQGEVLAFTHRYWFEDISAQLQAQELFALLRREMRLRDLYRQLAQESREAHALAAQKASHEEQKKQGRLGDAAQSLNVIAAVGLTASVIVGFFGMNVFEEKPFMTADRDFVWAWGLVMAGGFGALFLGRDRLIEWFAHGRPARRVLWVAAGLLVLVGLALLLRSGGGG